MCGLSIRAINDIYLRLRTRIADECMLDASCGQPELPQLASSEGNANVGEARVYGIRKHGDHIHAEMVPQPWPTLLLPLIHGRVGLGAIATMEQWHFYSCLVDLERAKVLRIDFAPVEKRSINATESFLSYAKRRLSKFNGVPPHTFHLHLKECEFRFNRAGCDLYKLLLKMLRDRPL